MCGITYYLNAVNIQKILEYFQKIQHRGPDNSGHVLRDGRFFGCHRLAITNIENGNQPLELNGVTLICNGQIYNYIELAETYDIPLSMVRTDVDIILHLYLKGIPIGEICNLLDGVFAFVLFNQNNKQLLIGRDPIGVRPLFWVRETDETETVSVVCSEIKGIDQTSISGPISVFPPNHYYDSLQNTLREYSNIYELTEEETGQNIPLEPQLHLEQLEQQVQPIQQAQISYTLPEISASASTVTIEAQSGIIRYELNNSDIQKIKEYITTQCNVMSQREYIQSNQNEDNDITNILSNLRQECDAENNENGDEYIIKSTIFDMLRQAVIKRIDNSDRPVAFLCSGGIDSSIIFAIAWEYLQSQNRDMYVYSMEFDDASESYDAFYAKLLMNEYAHPNLHYHPVKFNWQEVKDILPRMPQILETYDPNTIRASIPMYLLAKYLRENTDFKVFLSGEGADELFMGYNYFSKLEKTNDTNGGTKANKESARLLQNLHMFDVLRADRTFNANGLELRVPFLDKTLVNYVLKLNGNLKLPNEVGLEKSLLRNAVKEKLVQLGNSQIINRQKERFSDGCGFGYIPTLLNYVSKKTGSLTEKERIEKQEYLKWFDQYYGEQNHSLIVKRELPDWCVNTKNANLLVN